MKISNTGKEFTLKHDSVEHVIPEGEFEVNDVNLANFILTKSRAWGMPVTKVSATIAAAIQPIEKIKKEEPKVEKVEEVKEVKETKKKK